MATALNNLRKQFITLRKSDLNYRLMLIAARMQLTAAQTQGVTEEKANITKAQLDKIIAEGGIENLTLEKVESIELMTADLDVELTLLALNDEELEAEMKSIETELKALDAEEEQIDKTLDKSIKAEFGTFAS